MADRPAPGGEVVADETDGATPRPLVAASVAARREFEHRVLRASLIGSLVVWGTIVGALLVWRLRVVWLLVLVSIFVAALLHPVVRYVERRGLRRGVATVVVFVAALVVFVTLGVVLVHPVIGSATHFVKELPKLVRNAEHGRGQIGHLVARFHLVPFVESHQADLEHLVTKLGKPALAVGKTVVSGAVAIVTIVFLSFFILLEAPRLVRHLLSSMQEGRAARLSKVLNEVGDSVTGYMLGNVATSVIAGVVVGLSLYVVGVPFPAVLGLWVALVDFLPMIGGLLAGVPTVIIAFLHSIPAGIVVLAVFLVYQQVENHILNPLIMSRTVRLNPLWVLLAVLIGAELGALVGSVFGGLVGALLAVPAASIIQVVARDLVRHRTGAVMLGSRPDLPATGGAPPKGAGAPGEGSRP